MPTAKNSILPILAAALLCRGPVVLRRAPRLRDVDASLALLAALGCTARRAGADLQLAPADAVGDTVPPALMAAMRSSVYYLAPMLARAGRARVAFPGGCRLGARPIDIHLAGLAAMGAVIDAGAEALDCRAPGGLRGCEFHLRFPSVGATETLMIAAAAARGRTVLTGAAREPEIADLAAFLNACGAAVAGAGGDVVTVEGARPLHGCAFTPIADRITAQTVLCAAAACGGSVLLRRAPLAPLQPTAALLRRAGCQVSAPAPDCVALVSEGRLDAAGELATGVYPAFATDAGPLFAAAMLRARGVTLLRETIFARRFACAGGFAALGADVRCCGGDLRICGVPRLRGAPLAAADLRGGAALVLAALAAEGESTISGTEYIGRGYENIAALFAGLGADIRTAQD